MLCSSVVMVGLRTFFPRGDIKKAICLVDARFKWPKHRVILSSPVFMNIHRKRIPKDLNHRAFKLLIEIARQTLQTITEN